MTTVYHPHDRTSPPHVKKQATRAHRPIPLTRGVTQGSPKLGVKRAKSSANVDEEEDMATSFLQFCATCEKQIIVPNNAILYCSESCRRKDAAKPPSYNPHTLAPSPSTSPFFHFAADEVLSAPRDIVPPHLPTARTLSSFRIPSTVHDAKADIDPTEWKPKLEVSSEAFQYLSQFHRSPTQRPALQHRSTTSTGITTPSLSYTPTTTASSLSTDPPCSFYSRPLPPRQTSFASSAKSIDLVIPHPTFTQALGATSVPGSIDATGAKRLAGVEANTDTVAALTYEKKWILPTACSPSASSLKNLLYFEHMQGKRE